MATQTVAQRRAGERAAFNAYLAACPSRQVLDRISDKWITLVLPARSPGPQRYRDLSATIAGVSDKMLTQSLRGLERDGLVSREVTAAVPVRVDYELTDLGRSLLPVVHALKTWAETNIEAVHAACNAYDARQQAAGTA